MSGKVIQIFICATKGEPMNGVAEVLAINGIGLEGDRYAAHEGAYPTGRNHVTLIASEAIAAANQQLAEPFPSSQTRRNIVTQDVPVNDLVDKEFSIGGVKFLGVKICDPCSRPAAVAGRGSAQGKLFEAAFENQGGLNAEVLSDGVIHVGDSIVYE